jgi:outer membrane protein OmpA-like peptidoglycan-associated protein
LNSLFKLSYMKLIFSLILTLLLLQLHAQTPTIIQFGFDKSILNASSKEQLTNFVKENPTITSAKIELYGHCDSSGPSTYNVRLSIRRVEAVHQFLLSEGVADSVIIVKKGYGENKPLNDNATKEQRSLNRRVELIVAASDLGTTLTVDQILSGAKISSGDKITLKNINFIGGYHYFINESLPALSELLKVMKSHPTMIIRVEGHICCGPLEEGDGIDLGTEIKNLSVARAKAVQEYLVNNGIEASRISSSGFGHTKPLFPYPEKTKEEELANRRVEVVIISMQ